MTVSSVEVFFPTLGESARLVGLHVVRSEFAHERVVLQIQDPNLRSRAYQTDLPVVVWWGTQGTRREEFAGYVHHPRAIVDSESSEPDVLSLVCVGPTRVLRNEIPQDWGRVSPGQAARMLCEKNRLGLDDDPFFGSPSNVAQQNESGWEFLVRIAKENGRHLSVTKTLVHLWNVQERAEKAMESAHVFSRSSSEIVRFRPSGSEMNADAEGRHVQFYPQVVPPDNITMRRSDHARVGFSRSDTYLTSPRYAVLDDTETSPDKIAITHGKDHWVQTATASLAPRAAIRPGDWVFLDDMGPVYSGAWFVNEASFRLSPSEAVMDVKISRPTVEDTGYRPAFPGRRYRSAVRSTLADHTWADRSRR